MPGKQAAEKGAGSDAASTPSNYLTIRDTAGTAIPATVDPSHDATTMMVTFTPPNKGMVTMTVTNPYKQTIACKLDVS